MNTRITTLGIQALEIFEQKVTRVCFEIHFINAYEKENIKLVYFFNFSFNLIY